MKKRYIKPTLYARQFIVSNMVMTSPGVEDGNATEDGSVVDGTDHGNGGSGLAKSDTWEEDMEYILSKGPSWGSCW